MARRYEYAMQKHGRRKKGKAPVKGLDFQMVSLLTDPKESEYEASWKRDLFSTGESDEDKAEAVSISENLPVTVHAVGIGEQNPNYIGQEFSGITDRITKLLTEYESLYDDKDQQGYAAMQEHLGGQIAMEGLLSDYKSLCREREELLNSLQDSFDVDEEEMLDALEAVSRKEHAIDMEGAQQAIHDTFHHVRETANKLQIMNKKMVDLSKAGESTESLEQEKRQLERELQMYKKMAVQQRKDIFNRRSSIRRDDTQQWKLVAGEMVDILNTVRHEGKLDKESLEKELNKIILTLNSQTEFIDNLKRELSKQEKSMKNLEKEKNRLNNDKLLAEDQLQTKQVELKQCKQYLRKVLGEKKDAENKIKIDGVEIDLAEGTDEIKLNLSGLSADMNSTNILQAQVRDARKVVFKLEEENRELQRKLASLPAAVDKEVPAGEKSAEPSSPVAQEAHDIKSARAKDCPKCPSYKARLANCSEELKEKNQHIERLKDDLNKLRAQLPTSKKEPANVKLELTEAEGEAELKEGRFRSDKTSAIKGTEEIVVTAPSASSIQDEESEEEPIKEKTKKASTLTVPGKKTKQKTLKSPKKRKKVSKAKEEEKEDEKGDDEDKEEEEEVVEEEDKKQTEPATKKDKKGSLIKRRDLVVGECREEKAPYVKVREARMVTLADKGTQTSHYDRKALEENSQRQSVVRQPQPQRRSLTETIMAGVTPSAVEEETKTAMMFIKDEADRLCDEISGFVEYGFDLVQQGAKPTRLLIDSHLGEKGVMELLESIDNGPISIDKAKALKALMSSDHRKQSLPLASKRRRSSLQLERRGTIRRDSRIPLLDTPTAGIQGRKRDVIISTETDSAHPESDSLAEQKEDTLASVGAESQTEQPSDSVTVQGDTAVTTEQGPPVVRRNTLFPDQDSTNDAQTQENAGDKSSAKELQQNKEMGDDPGSKELQSIKTDEGRAQGKTDDNSLKSNAKELQQNKEMGDDPGSKKPLSIKTDEAQAQGKTDDNSLQPHTDKGCSHLVNEVKNIAQGFGAISSEDQIKEQVSIMAQNAIDMIQSTAQALSHQLQDELSLYEKFYRLWKVYRDENRPSTVLHGRNDDAPVVGVKILSTLDERENDALKTKESALFPPIIPQGSSFQAFGRGRSIAMAGLSREGMMMIHGAGPKTAEPVPTSISQSKMKKRGKVKNWSRKQLLMRQKAVLDKVLHVDARIEDLRNIFSEAGETQTQYIRQSQGIPPAISQDYYSPLTAHSVTLPSLPTGLHIKGAVDRYSVRQKKEKKEAPVEVSNEAEHSKSTYLPSMNSTNTLWQRRRSIARFPSQRTVRKSSYTEQAKLPLLNINHYLKVGQ